MFDLAVLAVIAVLLLIVMLVFGIAILSLLSFFICHNEDNYALALVMIVTLAPQKEQSSWMA